MTSYPEHHPWLKIFTVLAIVAGGLVFVGGLAALSNAYDSEAVLYGLLAAMGGVGIAWAGVHTLRVTGGFRQWDSGVSERDKAIGTLCIVIGAYISIGLIFALPFMRFVEGTVGEGLGVRRR